MRTRKRRLSLLLCVMLICVSLPLPVSAAEESRLVIGTAEGMRGDIVTVDVSLTSVNGIASGGFTISYNSSNLIVDDAEAGVALADCTPLINTEYSQSSIRVSFMKTEALSSAGTLVSIRFKIKDNASIGSYALTASNVKFSDVKENVVTRSAESGSISIRGVSVSLSSAEIVGGQGTDLDLCILPPVAPCGGMLTLRYNSAFLSCGKITPVKKMGDTAILLESSVDEEKGIISISWMASKPISDFGKLCSIHIETDKQAVGVQNISLEGLRFVDQNAETLPCETPTKASIIVTKRPDDLPKLYFTDSSLDESTGIVTISACIDGADLACAGNVKIQYDASSAVLVGFEKKLSGLVVIPELPEKADGCIQLVWASADPLGEDVCLVTLKFQLEKTASSDLVYSDIQLCDKGGVPIALYDLEGAEIFGQKQWAKVSELSTSEGKSVLNIKLDESIPSSTQMMLAAYDSNGRFEGIYVCTADELNQAKSENGAAITFVQADTRKLFLLTVDSSPLCGSVEF